MARPNPYARQQNFTNWQSNNPGVIYNGTDFDNEFNAIATALNQTIANVAQLQRGDGALMNQIVGRDQLAASVVQGINTPAAWVSAKAYSQRDSVLTANAWYWCNIAHTAGVFATDLAAGKWILINDFSLALPTSFTATSATNNVAIGTGAKTLVIQSGKSFIPGSFVQAVDSGNAANSITGTVTSYSGTTLVINATGTTGGGTPAGWSVTASGAPGASASAVPWAAAAGTANAITATYTPPNGSLTDGLLLSLRASAANSSTAPTFAPDGLAAHPITQMGGAVLAAGNIAAGGHECLVRYNLANTRWELLNPAYVSQGIFTTGDLKVTIKTTADAGWIMTDDGTIGDASSGASNRANADTVALFTLLWTNTANAQCPVSGGRGVSAAADFAAHKTITIPQMLGRALGASGTGSGLTSRSLAGITGAEQYTLLLSDMPATILTYSATGPGLGSNGAPSNVYGTSAPNPISLMQPIVFLNLMIKL